MRRALSTLTLAFLVCLAAAPALAQAPEPPKIWTVQLSGGLALTSGNSDTSNLNGSYDITWDRQQRNVVKSDALFLRGTTEGELSANRVALNVRDEYRLTTRAFVFAQNQYLRDEFKDIDYLLAPTAGFGYKLADSATTKLTVDGSLGGVWERNPGLALSTSGAVAFGEKLTQTLTTTTTLTQSFAALWKTSNFSDALYTAGVGIAASMSTRTQLKFEVQNIYKNLPPLPTIQKNDVAVVMAIVFKS